MKTQDLIAETDQKLRKWERDRLGWYIQDLRQIFQRETDKDKLFAVLAAIAGIEDYLKLS
jgi:hypothetical protein